MYTNTRHVTVHNVLAGCTTELDNHVADIACKSGITYQLRIEGGLLRQPVMLAYANKRSVPKGS
jgi:hypothetical protein